MIRLLFIFFFGYVAICYGVNRMTTDDETSWFDSQKWKHRMVVISGDEETVRLQRDRFLELDGEVLDRDLIVLTIVHPPQDSRQEDSLPDHSQIKKHFNIDSTDFQILLVGKDGGVKERRFEPIQPGEFFDCIDAMPMRLDELRIRHAD